MDTRSDVYSLGVLLYELLTGSTPFEKEQFLQAGYDEMRRMIREDEPPRPSTRLSTMQQALVSTIAERRGLEPRRLSQQLRGELDWIAMKALEKDRSRRYESASALAADVQRYLADEPVQACPPSAWYRFRKLTRRKKTALVMAAGVFLALAGIAAALGWAVRDRLAREEALDQVVAKILEDTEPLLEQEKWPEAQALLEQAEKLLAIAERADRPPRLVALQNELSMAERLEEVYGDLKRGRKAGVLTASGKGTGQTDPAQSDPFEEEFSLGGRGTMGGSSEPSRSSVSTSKPCPPRKPLRASRPRAFARPWSRRWTGGRPGASAPGGGGLLRPRIPC